MANSEKTSLLRFCLASLRSNDVLVIQVNDYVHVQGYYWYEFIWINLDIDYILIWIDYVQATPFISSFFSAQDMSTSLLAKVSPVLLCFA